MRSDKTLQIGLGGEALRFGLGTDLRFEVRMKGKAHRDTNLSSRLNQFYDWLCLPEKSGSPPARAELNFQDYGEDEGALGGLFVDVTLQVDADFFLNDAPVGFFFGVGLFDGFHDDFAGAGD